MAVFAEKAGIHEAIGDGELRNLVLKTVRTAAGGKKLRRMLLLPPDHTRLNSRAGKITEMIYGEFGNSCEIVIMPALGTHAPMGEKELSLMFGDNIPRSIFRVHDWRNDVVTLGKASGGFIRELSGGKLDYEVEIAVNKILFEDWDLILSIGQVVPHEVAGMANYTKNIMVGVGGPDIINKSHFLGAVSNLETIMGHADSPVRRLFNYGVDTFLADRPIVYMLSVMARNSDTGKMEMRGFFSGRGADVFEHAAKLAVDVNLVLLDKPLRKVVVYLDPEEFKSTWLGNKAVYRTRMAIADGGELVILAPGLKEFGEDPGNDRMIRKYGYKGTPHTLKAVAENADLRNSLGAAAHLIHGSSEGRFTITYCPGKQIAREEVESVGFATADLDEMMAKYDVAHLRDGFNTVNGEEIFYISNPALGLWALKKAFYG